MSLQKELKTKRKFTSGRQSDQLMTEEMFQTYNALKNINYRKTEHKGLDPAPAPFLNGSLWFDAVDNVLKYYDLPTRTWKSVFAKQFQITSEITNIYMPANPVQGQLWIDNSGVLMYFNGSNWQPVKALEASDNQWGNTAFENFQLVSPLVSVNEINHGYCEDGAAVVTGEDEKETESFKGWYREYITDSKWDSRNFEVPELKYEPVYTSDDLSDPDYLYVIPNLNTDKVFLGHLYSVPDDEIIPSEIPGGEDTVYSHRLSDISFRYRKLQVLNKRVTGVHINPGRLTGIKKRIFFIDKEHPEINVSGYNTEFYGFTRNGFAGDLLLPSVSQGSGDYTVSGDKIILNKHASEHYDYVVSITYEFTWVNSNGRTEHHTMGEESTSYYMLNLRDPVSVHVEGFQMEEAAYKVDFDDSTITIEENIDGLDIDIWSPYKKQYGYIRRTQPVTAKGIIHLHESISSPDNVLVFVAGQLIHPVYGGLEFDLDNRNIFVSNPDPEVDNMINMPWCVVDLAADKCKVCGYAGVITDKCPVCGEESNISRQDTSSSLKPFAEETVAMEENVYNYILDMGKFTATGRGMIHYDRESIEPDDGILLFVDGLLVCPDDIIRDDINGVLTVAHMVEGMEYVLLRDREGRLYNSSDMLPAYRLGVLSDSVVYFNGQLILNDDCFSTTDTEEICIYTGAVHNEIKCFIIDEAEDIKAWRIFDAYEYTWNDIVLENGKSGEAPPYLDDLNRITSSYSNLLCSVEIKLDYSSRDKIDIIAYRFANTVSGYYDSGVATYEKDDEIDGLPIYTLGMSHFAYRMNNLNLYRNGVKLVNNLHYVELQTGNQIKLLIDLETDPLKDLLLSDEKIYDAWKLQTGKTRYVSPVDASIKYIIEPIESGQECGYEQVIMESENAVQTNIYKLEEGENDLYPGRLTVYVNGIRLSNRDWVLLDNRHIMLKYNDYKAVSETAGNCLSETYIKDGNYVFAVNHKYPDYIVVEKRFDYDRNEVTIEFRPGDGHEIYLDEKNIPINILDTPDEILFFWNGQYTGLSRKSAGDYRIDKYKGCITLLNPVLLARLTNDKLGNLFDRNDIIAEAWKERTGETEYSPSTTNNITMIWRT